MKSDDPLIAYQNIQKFLKNYCDVQTDFEKRFIDLCFAYCLECVTPQERELRLWGSREKLPIPKNDVLWVFDALMPLPQAHLYLRDPLENRYSFVPENMVKVDFGLWTGREILAVEIDGGSHIGSEQHIKKDRLLQRAGVKVIHILNKELLEYGKRVIGTLFPEEVTQFWKNEEYEGTENPLSDIPF